MRFELRVAGAAMPFLFGLFSPEYFTVIKHSIPQYYHQVINPSILLSSSRVSNGLMVIVYVEQAG